MIDFTRQRAKLLVLMTLGSLSLTFGVPAEGIHPPEPFLNSKSGKNSFSITAVRPPSTPSRDIPDEPGEYDPREVKAYYDWRNDMFFREFDIERTGRVDFMTARRTYKVSLNEFGHSVVLTMANPVFYWIDFNRNGSFEPQKGEMWSDPEEDGLNGNEKPYGY